MGHIIRSLVLVLFIQLFVYSEPKTIVYNSYTNDRLDAGMYGANRGTVEKASELSSGRAFSSSASGPGGAGGFPYRIHPDFLSKPVQVARPDAGYKSPKYIVYPSYSENSPNSVPYYNAPVAMDRFAPGEAYGGTIYKLKKAKQPVLSASGGAPFGSVAAASINSPVSVPSPNGLRAAASDNNPISVLAPPSAPPSNGPSMAPAGPPPPPQPPSAPSSSSGMSGSPNFFMPTPVPNSGEDSSSANSTEPPNTNSTMDSSELILSPPNSHSGFLPPDKSARDSKPSLHELLSASSENSPATTESPSGSAVYKPPAGLFQFPPNSNSSYLPPTQERSKNPVTSYLPPPSGDNDPPSDDPAEASPYKSSVELFKFPPNVNSSYLPPVDTQWPKHTATSYLPPPSGDPSSSSNSKPVINNEWTNPIPSVAPNELHRFPPNVLANYSPSSGKDLRTLSATSYLPPPSGDPQAPDNAKPLPSGGSDELYKFPPNVDTAYLPSKNPSEAPVTSYLPPPSGTQSTMNTFQLRPNVQSNYLPPVGMRPPAGMQVPSYLPPPSGNPDASPMRPLSTSPYAYMPPADLFKFPPNVQSQYLPPNNSPPTQNNAVTSYLPPASGIPGDDGIGTIPVGPGKPQYLPPRYPDSGPPPMQMAPMKMPSMPMMPPMAPMDTPMDSPPMGPSGMDGDHDHHHYHDHDFPYFTGFDHDHYSDIIYDHDHHHHDEPPTTPAPPPPPPPPPAPETPRLKNYSYYYLSRTLWYVPLYFTLYFTVYVAVLIIRSIARHKVNLPNQWVGNGRSFSSIRDLSDKEAKQKATMMATFMMKQIDDFREKYL